METAKLNIKQWAEDDRPREKMMQKGASALSNAELLAKSERIAKVIEEIDEKTMRWLELSELA